MNTKELTTGCHELVGELIAIRRQRGMLQRDVARRVGVCTSAIGHLEARRRLPSLEAVLRYADAVGAAVLVVAK